MQTSARTLTGLRTAGDQAEIEPPRTCRQGKRVRSCAAAGLINEQPEAQDQFRSGNLEASLGGCGLMVSDDIVVASVSKEGHEALLIIWSSLYRSGSPVFIASLDFIRRK